MTHYSFSLEDQISFAKLSGDYNPVHIDPVKARRTNFGHPVVHGIHALLWALENLVADESGYLKLVSLKTHFNRAISLGEVVKFVIKSYKKNFANIQLLSQNGQVVRIRASFSPSNKKDTSSFPDSNPHSQECLEQNPNQLANASGSLDLCLNQSEMALRFPNLMQKLPSNQLAELMAITRLVGMECPGLHSIFSELNLQFSSPRESIPQLSYKVLSYDTRIGLLTQNVQTSGMTGTLKAFVRPPPQSQRTFLELSEHVKKGEFSDQTALIIGGSRGLGEVTGKLLAAGGARIVICYHMGSEEAQTIVKQVQEEHGEAICLAYDVLCPKLPQNCAIGGDWQPTHLYYFATPKISQGKKNSFSPSLFKNFCDYYVTGFLNTFQTFQAMGKELQGIFYPSTIFINELQPGLAEYASAKSAGETLCAYLRKTLTSMNIYAPRLPITATDQTSSFLPNEKEDPGLLMLDNLRQFRDQGKF